jgi:transposase
MNKSSEVRRRNASYLRKALPREFAIDGSRNEMVSVITPIYGEEDSIRLETIPGIGFITATAITATVTDPSQFTSGRQFAAWLGLVPRQNSSGGKDRLGRISKMGNQYLRRLLVVGATALIRFARNRATPLAAWADKLLARRPARLVSVALANKIARAVWALLVRGGYYGSQVSAIPA